MDAGLGCHDPEDEVWAEAQDIWSPEEGDLTTFVRYFITGTVNPGTSIIEDNALKIVTETLKEIATEMEKTAESFAKGHRGIFSQQRYFRLNVNQELQNVNLQEFEKENIVASATGITWSLSKCNYNRVAVHQPGKIKHVFGTLYMDQGELQKAESMLQRALTGHEKALGPDHTSTLNTVNKLGILYRH